MTAANPKPAGRGGARSGAGAKAADGATALSRYNVTLDPETEALARQLGNGDRSLGIRIALRAQLQGGAALTTSTSNPVNSVESWIYKA